jgi:hypothetical protein
MDEQKTSHPERPRSGQSISHWGLIGLICGCGLGVFVGDSAVSETAKVGATTGRTFGGALGCGLGGAIGYVIACLLEKAIHRSFPLSWPRDRWFLYYPLLFTLLGLCWAMAYAIIGLLEAAWFVGAGIWIGVFIGVVLLDKKRYRD